jgi:hypothetical protein
MDTWQKILDEAQALHDQSAELLAELLAGRIQPPPPHTVDEWADILREDIDGTRNLLKSRGRDPDAPMA